MLSRREALGELGLGALAIALAGCAAGGAGAVHDPDGSTLQATYGDPAHDGQLALGAGVPLIDRTDLAPQAAAGRVLASIAHLTDAHVMDSQSPARVPFLRRLGAPFNSTFRPQEALTAHVLAGACRALDALAPDAIIQGGDLIDNAQENEMHSALVLLRGGRVHPGSGAPGYYGVQSASDPDPFYYRPDVDAPRHPGLLQSAMTPFAARGLRAPVYPVLGDHDLLVQGVLAPTPATRAIALGERAIWDLPANLRVPRALAGVASGSSPDALAAPELADRLIVQAQRFRAVRVAADASRRELSPAEVLARLRSGGNLGHASGVAGVAGAAGAALLDYSFDVGTRVRVIVLDLVRREGGSGGVVHGGQAAWLASELTAARGRWVLVVSHQPLADSEGGETLLALLDAQPRVLAALAGHTHRNRITARPGAAGGYWLINTCSLIDYPQQARALQIRETAHGGAVIDTWMLDHPPDGGIADISRELSYLDSQGGRPQGFAGGPLDRNVRLFLR
jgi:hypothetical protein